MKLTAWSSSRLNDYETCPALGKYKHLDKLCPLCFDGRIRGGYDTPAICDACGETVKAPEAITRGIDIDKKISDYLMGTTKELNLASLHPKVREILFAVREICESGDGEVQSDITLNHLWLPVDRFSPDVWLRAKLDAVTFVERKNGDVADVIDWKSGNVDRRTGAVRLDRQDKYMDQLELYQVAILCADPALLEASARLVFVDCGKRFDPVLTKAAVKRAELPMLQKKWAARVRGMLDDQDFAPKANPMCKYCDFQKARRGPCKF